MYVFFEIPKGELPLSKQLVTELLQSEISPQFPLASDKSQCALRAQDIFLCQVSIVFSHVFIIHFQHGYFWRLIKIQININNSTKSG